jgi:hypothetical protein
MTEVQDLIDDPDIESVEIKLTVRNDQEGLVRDALARADAEAEERTVYFFDTPDLRLYDAGLVVRARQRDGEDDSTVKLRPVVPNEIHSSWKKLAEFTIQLDAVGTNMVCSAKLEATNREGEVDEVIAGTREVSKLLSKAQEKLLDEYAPEGVNWTGVGPLGPIQVFKWKLEPKDLDHELVVEQWVLPDGSDLVELSITIEPDQIDTAGEKLRTYLTGQGLDVAGDQQTKTKTALGFFTGIDL